MVLLSFENGFSVPGVDHIYIQPGSKVLYIGAAAGTTVSHVSDIVGPSGCVYAVEFSHRPGFVYGSTNLFCLCDEPCILILQSRSYQHGEVED